MKLVLWRYNSTTLYGFWRKDSGYANYFHSDHGSAFDTVTINVSNFGTDAISVEGTGQVASGTPAANDISLNRMLVRTF
jgi:hypothetical protein